ncbi:hypothetical protein MLD38_012731 [Melastoma candidum]|uniref:Uncharacterized protein n=1 Tax=Melastoma candidum TaxID=119954 RepID=A0ACB9RAX4_9MYRT|nr:hypothetical protein MLD38_012731 [Melastoma candidum]
MFKVPELLSRISSPEIKLCKDATKEFVKLLRRDRGGELLRLYVRESPGLPELLEAWEARRDKPGVSYVLRLITAILSHPDGLYVQGYSRGNKVAKALDRFCKLIISERLEDVYKELGSKEAKGQNAALRLLSSIVRRGSGLASEVAKSFDFRLPAFRKLAECKSKGKDEKRRRLTQESFIGFAMSFLEVGRPGLLRWILQQKEMYSGVLRGIGEEDEETVVYVLSTLQKKVLCEDSLVPPGLRSVLFGSVMLEQLIGISGRENGGPAAGIAHDVLLMVCTDPANGLMPDMKRSGNPLKGNPSRLLGLMKKLRATEVGNHKALLLAIVNGRPSLGASYMEEFPYNIEDISSPSWFSIVLLAAEVVSSVSSGLPFAFLEYHSWNPPAFHDENVQNVLKCLLLEGLKFLGGFSGALDRTSRAFPGNLRTWESLRNEIWNQVQTMLPDAQVLVNLLSPIGSSPGGIVSNWNKRPADAAGDRIHNAKKVKIGDDHEEEDMVVSGVTFSPNDESENPVKKEDCDGNDILCAFGEIWSLDLSLLPTYTMRDAEIYHYSRLMEVLHAYLRMMPAVLEGSFEFFVNILGNALELSVDLLDSLLAILTEYTKERKMHGLPHKVPTQMHRHLQTFLKLLLSSETMSIREQAFGLARAALMSTGAFSRNSQEIDAWFTFLPGYLGKESSCFEEIKVLQTSSRAVVTFFCDAISYVANNLFKSWDFLRQCILQPSGAKGISPNFSPVTGCILQRCLKVLKAGATSFSGPEKTAISVYVCCTMKYILQTQVDAGCLSAVIVSVLSEVEGSSIIVENSLDSLSDYRPLRSLLLFARRVLNREACWSIPVNKTAVQDDISSSNELDDMNLSLGTGPAYVMCDIANTYAFTIMSTSSNLVIRNFPAVITLVRQLDVIPLALFSLFFLEQSLLAGVDELWPGLLHAAVKAVVGGFYPEKQEGSSEICNPLVCAPDGTNVDIGLDVNDSSTAVTAFCFFLKLAPFHVLIPAVICFDENLLSDSKMQKLLMDKISESGEKCLASELHFVLFWIHQLQQNVQSIPVLRVRNLSGFYIVLLSHIFSRLLASECSETCSRSGMSPSVRYIHEAIKAVFSHPAVITSWTCSCSFSETSSKQNYLDKSLNLSREEYHEKEHQIFGTLETASNFLWSVINDPRSLLSGTDNAVLQAVKAFKVLMDRLILDFHSTLDLCVQNKHYSPLLRSYHAVCIFIRFISPFEIFKLVCSLFSIVKFEGKGVSESFRKLSLHIGCCFAGSAFEALRIYLSLPLHKQKPYDYLWGTKEDFNVSVYEEIYFEVLRFSGLYDDNYVDMCLVKAIEVACKMKVGQHLHLHPFCLGAFQIIGSTPIETISCCINRTNSTTAKLLSLLTGSCSLHLFIFGHILSHTVDPAGNLKNDGHPHGLSDKDLLILLPAAFSFLNSALKRYKKHSLRNILFIPLSYSKFLINWLCNWKNFSCTASFLDEYGEFFPNSADELLEFAAGSILGKAIQMLQIHLVFSSDTMKEPQLKLFNMVMPDSAAGNELLGCDVTKLGTYSIEDSLNFSNRVLAKVSLCRIILFHKKSIFSNERTGSMDISSEGIKSDSLNSSRMEFVSMLVYGWQRIVKTEASTGSDKGKSVDGRVVCSYLEVLLLRNVYELILEMQEYLIQLKHIPFLKRIIKTALRYRFEDLSTLKLLNSILVVLGAGEISLTQYLQLLLAHSRFPAMLHSMSDLSTSSQLGSFLRPFSSILNSNLARFDDQYVPEQKETPEAKTNGFKRLEVLKLLRTLLNSHNNGFGSDFGKEIGLNFREFRLSLFSSYGATLSEIDLEIYNLVKEIGATGRLDLVDLGETNYLWGSAVGRAKNEFDQERDVQSDVPTQGVADEHKKMLFRENFPIDPMFCILTVLHFPYDREMHSAPASQKILVDSSMGVSQMHSRSIDRRQLYDPVFILQFSLQVLFVGFIEPEEFASQGLLSVVFSCLSSPDEAIRKLAYQTLAKYKNILEMKKETHYLRLLLDYVQNGIKDPWQRIPSVLTIFLAEASLILLDRSHDKYPCITKLLTRCPGMDMKSIPLFHDFLWSSTVNFSGDRIWLLRLAYYGLNTEDDARVFIRSSVFESLLGFYASPFSDDESKGIILQILRKAVKLHRSARYLVENCGLLPQLSSVVLSAANRLSEEGRSLSFSWFVVSVEVAKDLISSRSVTEWLQNSALEQLMEFSTHVFKLYLLNIELMGDNSSLMDSILHVIMWTLKISQKRKIYQPHYTIALEGIFGIYESANLSGACSEIGLRVVLMSSPPFLLDTDGERLCGFLTWAISVVLGSDSGKMINPGVSYISWTCISKEEIQEDTLASKLLRWLAAAVIHSKLSCLTLSEDAFSKRPCFESSLSFVHYVTQNGRCKSATRSVELLASAIYYLQQFLGINSRCLPSVVSALCLLLPVCADVSGQESESSSPGTAASALSRISPPPEANPAWRWSFYQPWRDLTSEKTDSEEMDEYHACQTLLVEISNKMGRRSANSQFLSAKDLQESGLFEWERELIISNSNNSFTNPTL